MVSSRNLGCVWLIVRECWRSPSSWTAQAKRFLCWQEARTCCSCCQAILCSKLLLGWTCPRTPMGRPCKTREEIMYTLSRHLSYAGNLICSAMEPRLTRINQGFSNSVFAIVSFTLQGVREKFSFNHFSWDIKFVALPVSGSSRLVKVLLYM